MTTEGGIKLANSYVLQMTSNITTRCALKHAPEVTPFGLKISLEDWELFKIIKDKSVTVLRAMKALAGKQKMPDSEENGEE